MLVLSFVEDSSHALRKFQNMNELNRPKIFTSSTKAARALMSSPKRITGSDLHIDATNPDKSSTMDLAFIYMDGMGNSGYNKENIQIILYLKKDAYDLTSNS